jgi:hypothetical protein
MARADDHSQEGELESREPSVGDLAELCRDLSAAGARYLVIGGFELRAAGYASATMNIDLIIEARTENEARVFQALAP